MLYNEKNLTLKKGKTRNKTYLYGRKQTPQQLH